MKRSQMLKVADSLVNAMALSVPRWKEPELNYQQVS